MKKTPDSPPDTTKNNPDLTANTTIRELKNNVTGVPLPKDIIISGVVVMSDKSGNYFKSIVLEDSSGGIEVALDRSYLYTDFPVGRRVFIKCGGLFLGKKNGMLQLGATPDASGIVRPIPDAKISEYLFPGKFPVAVQAHTVPIAQLAVTKESKQYLNTLVTISGLAFADSNKAVPYALSPDVSPATTRRLINCSSTSILLRTSGYALFQSYKTPSGKGTITALYTQFNQIPQLYIRDTSDIKFYGKRCSDLPPANGSRISMNELRHLQQGVTLPDYTISGVVISDKNFGNTPLNKIVLQGSRTDGGITLLFEQPVNFQYGDSLKLSIQGGALANHYGALILKGIPPNTIQVLSQNHILSPTPTSIAQIKTNPGSFAYRLVRLENIHLLFPNSATFNGQSGNLSLTDGSDTLQHFCEQTAVFRNDSIPNDSTFSVTGYIFIQNNQTFIKMRNPGLPEDDWKSE